MGGALLRRPATEGSDVDRNARHRYTLRHRATVLEKTMHIVTISPKFQVVVPRAIREAMQLSAGQKLCMLHFDHRLQLILQQHVKTLRDSLAGIDTNIDRS